MVHRRTLKVVEVSEGTKRLMIKVAKVLLDSVGQLPSSVEQISVAVHYRRALTDDEYGLLTDEWCSIEPVHESGRGLVLEENT